MKLFFVYIHNAFCHSGHCRVRSSCVQDIIHGRSARSKDQGVYVYICIAGCLQKSPPTLQVLLRRQTHNLQFAYLVQLWLPLAIFIDSNRCQDKGKVSSQMHSLSCSVDSCATLDSIRLRILLCRASTSMSMDPSTLASATSNCTASMNS